MAVKPGAAAAHWKAVTGTELLVLLQFGALFASLPDA